jgi:tRNA threonylcarbamoyladenosine dehydratase
MESWFSRVTNSHKVQLTVTAIISGGIGISVILGYQRLRRRQLIEDVKSSIPDISQEHVATQVGNAVLLLNSAG